MAADVLAHQHGRRWAKPAACTPPLRALSGCCCASCASAARISPSATGRRCCDARHGPQRRLQRFDAAQAAAAAAFDPAAAFLQRIEARLRNRRVQGDAFVVADDIDQAELRRRGDDALAQGEAEREVLQVACGVAIITAKDTPL